MERKYTIEEYNSEPVYYCKSCLSLRVRNVDIIDNSEYCDYCGSTDIETASIEEWQSLYKQRYGHDYLEEY